MSAGSFPPVTTKADNNGANTYVAGDGRVSEHSVLTSSHTVWLREHNRLCKTLKKSNMSEDAKFKQVKAVCFGATHFTPFRSVALKHVPRKWTLTAQFACLPRLSESQNGLQVIIAKLQQITVKEFLPVLIGVSLKELRAWDPLSDKPDISVEVRNYTSLSCWSHGIAAAIMPIARRRVTKMRPLYCFASSNAL